MWKNRGGGGRINDGGRSGGTLRYTRYKSSLQFRVIMKKVNNTFHIVALLKYYWGERERAPPLCVQCASFVCTPAGARGTVSGSRIYRISNVLYLTRVFRSWIFGASVSEPHPCVCNARVSSVRRPGPGARCQAVEYTAYLTCYI